MLDISLFHAKAPNLISKLLKIHWSVFEKVQSRGRQKNEACQRCHGACDGIMSGEQFPSFFLWI